MREGTLEMRERGVQMRHFRAIAQDLAALAATTLSISQFFEFYLFFRYFWGGTAEK